MHSLPLRFIYNTMARRNDIDENLPKVKLSKDNLKKASRILRYLKPYRTKYLIGVLFLLLTSATALIFPAMMGDLIDAATSKTTPNKEVMLDNINRLGLILLLVFSLQAVFSYFRIVLFVNVTENVLTDLRRAAYAKLITQPMEFFGRRRVGELTSRISSDITTLQEAFTTTVAELMRQAILIIGGIALLSLTSIRLSLVMLALIPVLAILAVFFGRYIRRTAKQVQDNVAQSNTIVEETMQGITSVKAYTNEQFEIDRYRNTTQNILQIALKSGRLRGAFASFVIVGLFGGIIFIIWYASTLLAMDKITVGELVKFIIYTMYVGASIGGFAEMYATFQRAIGSTERILDIIDEEGEGIDLNYTQNGDKTRLKGEIAFNDVHFTYPSRKDYNVLNGISFTAAQGERVAIVGPSGAGKSTIIQLLQRFYAPETGNVLFDGKNAGDYDLTALRSNIAIVPQDVLLFGGSIKENIGYGKPGATDEEIMEAAKKANAHNFIIGFPEQYNTLVGDRGIQLSGGQRQRIAIARAVLKNPAILLLDEATSSLDSESERLVQDALDKLMQGRTSVIIAHRLSTIRDADKILVVERGKIIESGSHEELIKNTDGLYYSLSKLQFEFSDSER